MGVANSATTTATYQVSASADDGCAWSATEQDISSGYLMIGDDRTYTAPYYMSAMRFTNVDAPRNAQIVDARLKISSINEGYRGQIYGVIQAETADDVTDFSSRYIGAISKTTAATDWDHKDAWAANTYYTSPDISSVIQEVVSRPGWNSGNSISIFYSTRADSGKSRLFGSFESGAGFAAVLEITYETYSISGYITISGGGPLDGVTVSAGADIESTTTDAGGYYELFVPPGWSGSVSAKKIKWEINPQSYSYNQITADIDGQDYIADYIGIIIVKADGTGDCPTIQAAIDAAVDGDIVILQPGTYIGDGNRDIDFKGKAITVQGETSDPNDCIIDCQGTETEPHRGFKFVSGEDDNSVLEAITITNGYGPKEEIWGKLPSVGGGVYCNNSSPTISNCTIKSNSAVNWGGGIFNVYGSPSINNCTIISNSSSSCGGGIFNYNWSSPSSPSINNCTISNNSASVGGGGINNDHSSPTIINCVISNNSASGQGGGIRNYYYSSPSIKNCTISNNSAASRGGGIFNWYYSNPSIKNCTISNNSTTDGGGIFNYESSPTITNCFIRSNSVSGNGGGIYNVYSSPSINNCTIITNSADLYGGIDDYFCSPMLNNCIIWGNQPNQIRATTTVRYSDIQGGSTGVGNIDADPLFAADGYHLIGSSPCIDAGDPNYVAEPNETDIDGDPRVVGRIDMGADEVYSSTSALIVIMPGTLDFEAQGLNSAPQSQYVSIKNYGVVVLNWQILKQNCNWLIITPLSGQTESLQTDEVTISIDHNNIVYGEQSCQFQIVDPNAQNSPQNVIVNLEVLGPEFTVSPAQFDFETVLTEPNTAGQILFIQNTGYDTLRWQIAIPPDCNWLSVEPMSGQSTGEINEVMLSVDANGMDIGFNTCELTISDPNAENSPQTVQVSLHVYIEGQRHVPAEYQTIQAAVDAAFHGDEVIIEPGIYTGPGNYNIYFMGKAITVRSVAPNNPAIVAATIIEPNTYANGFRFDSGEQADSVVDGLTIRRCIHRAAIACYSSSPTIRNCIIEDNHDLPKGGGIGITCYDSSPVISNCVIRNNYGGGLRCTMSDPTVRNCTFTGNRASHIRYYGDNETLFGGGILFEGGDISVINCTFSGNVADMGGGICSFGSYANINNVTISNCIFRDNDANDGPQIALIDYGNNLPTVSVSYSDVQGGEAAVYVDPCCTLDWDDDNNLDIDPCFAVPGYWHTNDTPEDVNDDFWVNGDYHLRSQSGRWDPNTESWYIDANTSPCIDAGDPNSDWTAELWPHGKRINMGAYGGTPEASMSLSDAGNIADLNTDSFVNYADMMLFIDQWLRDEVLLSEDLDRNGIVNFLDFAILANYWLLSETTVEIFDPEALQTIDPNNIQGYVGIELNDVRPLGEIVSVYVDNTLLGSLWLGWDDEQQWVGLQSDTFSNGWHTIRLVSVDMYGGVINHKPINVYFNNLLYKVTGSDYFHPDNDYKFSGFYDGSNTLEAEVTNQDGQVIWSNTYSGPHVSITIPGATFGSEQFCALSVTEAGAGSAVTKKDLTKKFKQADCPAGVRMVIILPNKDVFKVRKPAIFECAEACNNRNVTWVVLYHHDVTEENLTFLYNKSSVRYIYWCGHANSHVGRNERQQIEGVRRTHTKCWRYEKSGWWDIIDNWHEIGVFSWTRQGMPGAPPLPNGWDTRGFDLWSLGMRDSWNKKIVFVDGCLSAKYNEMAYAYGVFSLQGQGSLDQIYIGWRIKVLVSTGIMKKIVGNTTEGVRLFWERMGSGDSVYAALYYTYVYGGGEMQEALWGLNGIPDIGELEGDDNIFLWGNGLITQMELDP